MSRRYDAQVEVRTGSAQEHGVRLEGALPADPEGEQEVPTLFLWRGRVHAVRAVLARWSRRVPWWRTDGDGAGSDAGAAELERTVWRVEATAGRSSGTGVYDLVQGEQWSLERVSD